MKTVTERPVFFALFLLSQITLFTGCSKQLERVNLSLSEDTSGDVPIQKLNLEASVNLGKVQLQNVTLPILDPRSGKIYGDIELAREFNGRTAVKVSVDTRVIQIADATLGRTLPNGRTIPLSVGQSVGAISGLRISEASRIYIGGDLRQTAVLGVALGIPALDQAMSNSGSAAGLFVSLPVNVNLFGVGGIYTSPRPNQNGVAVFAQLNLNTAAPSQSNTQSINLTSSRALKMDQFFNSNTRVESIK